MNPSRRQIICTSWTNQGLHYVVSHKNPEASSKPTYREYEQICMSLIGPANSQEIYKTNKLNYVSSYIGTRNYESL